MNLATLRLALVPLLVSFAILAPARARVDQSALTLVEVKALGAARIGAIGRVVPKHSARIGARVAGRIEAFGVDADGRPLDVGSRVEAGSELFHLERRALEAHTAVARAAKRRAEAALADLLAGTRKERIAAHEATLRDVDARLDEANLDLERYRRLVLEDKTAAPKRLEESETRVRVLEAERARAEATLDEARAGATPSEIALAEAAVVEAEASVRLAEVDLEDTLVRAPFSGVITARQRGVGDYLTPAPFIEVLELVSTEDLEVSARLAESLFSDVLEGATELSIETSSLDAPATLRVARKVGAIDAATGQFEIRATVPAALAPRLAPGAFVRISLQHGARHDGALVPASAVFQEDGTACVYVARDGRMKRVAVVLGERLSDGFVVRGGPLPGERVIAGPRAEIDDGRVLPPGLER